MEVMTTFESERPQAESAREVDALYIVSQPTILTKILESSEMTIFEGEYLAGDYLASHLDQYDGVDDEYSFIAWALSLPEIKRRMFFYGLRRDHRNAVRSGVWSVLNVNRDLAHAYDLSRVCSEIEQNVWVWAWQNIDKLILPDLASASTRLYAQGKFHAWTWRTDCLRRRIRFSDLSITGFGQDLATGKVFFDPGVHPEDPPEFVDDPRRSRRRSKRRR